MVDERVLERWMRLEIGDVNAALVRAPRPLADLLLEDAPAAATRNGEHAFDKDALRRLADALPPLVRARLRVPIHAYLDTEAYGEAYVVDPVAQKALAELGVAKNGPRGGKTWVSQALLNEFARAYPTTLQFVVL